MLKPLNGICALITEINREFWGVWDVDKQNDGTIVCLRERGKEETKPEGE